MAFENENIGDSEWDLWRKAVHNQVEQGSSIGRDSELKDWTFGDSIYDLKKKFTNNQDVQG